MTLGSLFDGIGGWQLAAVRAVSDTQRYRAICNGMAQPCADAILRNIVLKGGIL